MFIGAIADDLTGATDLALMLSRGGMRVMQTVGVPGPDVDFGTAEAVVVSLKSRTIPAAEAVAQSVAAAKVLLANGAEQLFFKYCSTFDSTDKGNIGPVTDALLDLLEESRTIACPAFPANKRTVFKGHLFVGDVLLSDSSMRDHPLTPMRDANLVRVLGRQTKRPVSLIAHDVVSRDDALLAAFDRLEGIAIVDATDETDLMAIGRAARGLKLVTGGSGVALGLPGNFLGPDRQGDAPRSVTAAPGAAVILAGSCSVATRQQIETAIAGGLPALQIDPLAIADGSLAVEDAVQFAHGTKGAIPLIYSSADPAEVAIAQERLGRDKAGEVVEHFLGAVARQLLADGFSRFLVAGGETSGAVVNALGIEALSIGPEIDPGVPWTTFDHEDRPVALALKSGNFGTPDFFVKAWSLVE